MYAPPKIIQRQGKAPSQAGGGEDAQGNAPHDDNHTLVAKADDKGVSSPFSGRRG